MKSPRYASIAALLLSLTLLACTPGRLHILIPDFLGKSVDGLRLYRVLDGGSLQAAGRVVFGTLERTANGLELDYTQIVPGHNAYGPLVARAKRPTVGQLELEMVLYNPGPGGRFRVATYNEKGTSRPSRGIISLIGGQ
jgi:hypothetical protein